MKDVQIFNFETNTKIRAVLKDGEPWFVAKDVCDAIGIINSRDAVQRLDDDEKMTVGLTDSRAGSGPQSILLINESGLYTIVLRSRKATTPGTPQHRFRKWVTSEVLPQIRKTGKYETPSDRMTDEQVGYIYNSVMRICGETGQTYQALFGMLKREFQVASYKHIKAIDFPKVCAVLGISVPIFTARAQQAIEHQEHYGYLNEIDAWNTINLWFRLKNLSEFMQDHMLPVLKKLDSGLFGRAYSLTHDPIMTLTLTEDCLLDLSKQFQQLDNKGMDWNERVSNIKNCTFKRLT
ncbi:BRO-N domain-containing protein [Oligella urethralis]|uniref:BRO-N domain-containing protein n=1 Tax=Oligella urethralis TaxID=90245 RepID=UPI002889D374|nr:Bro-N domain-containing protein [Oligella urethralis]